MPLRFSKWLLPGSLFLLFLLYFVFGAGWQEPTRLTLRGQAAEGATLTLRWDSGAGFNRYEQRTFRLNTRLQEDSLVSVTIGATGRRHPASQSKDVICEAVLVDGKPLDLSAIAGAKLLLDQGTLRFNKSQQLAFSIKALSQLAFRFRTDTASGIALVSVKGAESEHDLYMANVEAKSKQLDYWLLRPDNAFAVETALPRYSVRELEILNSSRPSRPVRLLAVELRGKNRATDLLQGQPTSIGQVRFHDVLDGMKNYFHPLQVAQQICFALLSAWLLTALLRFAGTLGGMRGCFLAEQRYCFWLMLATSLTFFGTWLAAFWPGVISIDSMKIWRAALLPDVYLNDHPFLNVILYKYLRHIWNNPAVVPLAQVLLSSLLAAWFGFWVFRQGAPLPFVLLCLLFILSSVAVGVYNTVLWKDIPFALLAVFWACILVRMRLEKQQQRLRCSGQRIYALILLGLALSLLRHNGLVYLAVLPALILLLGLVPLRKALPILAILLLAAGIGFVGLHFTAKKTGGAGGFLSQELRKYKRHLSFADLADEAQRLRRQYMTVLNINQTDQKWDKFHYFLNDRQAWIFLLHSGWWDVYPYQKKAVKLPALRKAALRLYEKSYEQPQVWFAWNPVWLLALLPLLTLLFFWLPNTAVLGAVLLTGALPLVYLQIFNWRYYYFLYLGLLFLPAFVLLDMFSRKKCASRS